LRANNKETFGARHMKLLASGLLLSVAALAAAVAVKALAQSNVYSLSIYAGRTSYQDLCALDFPLPPFHYKVTQRSRYETTAGAVAEKKAIRSS